MKLRSLILAALALVGMTPVFGAKPHRIHVVTTGDIHGSYFNLPYIGTKTRPSMMSVKAYVDSLRNAEGAENVILLDAGDCLQGDNAAYYFNYVAVDQPHVFPRLAKYMGYDAGALGNHDIETAHPVYDRVNAEMKAAGIPWLAGNAICPDGSSYFPLYTILHKGGLKVAVLGFDNANMSAWLSPDVFSGMEFKSLVPFVQEKVDEVVAAEKPQLVIAVLHSGSGKGDGSSLESQSLDVFRSIKGVDVVVGAHDHAPYTETKEGCTYINGGAHCGNVGHAVVNVEGRGRGLKKTVSGEIVRMDKNKVDEAMVEVFMPDYEAVKAFSTRTVGNLAMELRTRDAYTGMSDYVNFIHTVQLAASGARISFAAPLTFNGTVPAGQVIYNDMFTIYPYENQLFVLKLKGSEIKDYLEMSYDTWIVTPGEHVLNIRGMSDPRTGSPRWSFANRSYNFDSAAGINYTVDVTKPRGSRISISSFADGSAFDPDKFYEVAMTSYRANGGGDLLVKGAGIPDEELDSRIVHRYPEIRDMVYKFFLDHGTVDSQIVGNQAVIGHWEFIPEAVVAPLMKADMDLVF